VDAAERKLQFSIVEPEPRTKKAQKGGKAPRSRA
jgi:hypothetical protein